MTTSSPSTTDLSWAAGQVPVSTRYDDPYYSLKDGLAEARHVFLGGNDLPGRYGAGFQIAELGFGTGLNVLAAWGAWQGPGDLVVTSFEAHPLSPDQMRAALAPFESLAERAEALVAAMRRDPTRARLEGLDLRVIHGDARQTVPAWDGKADAWFLDGFAPAKNPELWDAALLQAVGDHTAPGGTFATYSAASHIRRHLAAAGFAVERVAGFAHKRHMSIGRRP